MMKVLNKLNVVKSSNSRPRGAQRPYKRVRAAHTTDRREWAWARRGERRGGWIRRNT